METDATGAITAEYVFFDGKRVALRKADGSVHYYFADQIGSANIVTNATGVMPPEQDIEFHPYGEQIVYTDTLSQEYRFTGKEHDPETGNDYFGARYYSSAMGRFLTSDWSATPVPIPYAVMGNPQTLNLYSYVENNPIPILRFLKGGSKYTQCHSSLRHPIPERNFLPTLVHSNRPIQAFFWLAWGDVKNMNPHSG